MKFKFAFSLILGGCSLAAMAQGGYQDGVDYFNADRFEQAKIILDKTLNDQQTDKAVAYYYLGALDLKNKNYAGAKANFEKGIAANRQNAFNYVGLGEIALLNGDTKAAELMFKDALKLDKKNYEVKVAVARAYFDADPVAYDTQIQHYLKDALKDSQNLGPAAYVLKGDMARKAGNVGEAAVNYEQAMINEESAGNVNPEAYVKYANLYNKVNNKFSIRKLEELKSKLPTSALAQRELAEKYYDAERYRDAAEEYRKYMDNPNHFQSDEQRYSQLLFFDKKYDESLARAMNVLNQDPGNYYMYRMVLLNADALGKNDMAEEYGAKLFAAPGAALTATDYNTYGRVLTANAKPEMALAIYERAYNSDPSKFANMLLNISDYYTSQNNYAKAAEYLQRYVDSGNANLTNQFDLAKLYGAYAQTCADDSAERREALDKGVTCINNILPDAATKAPLYRTKSQMLGLRDGKDISVEQVDTYLAMLAAYETENPEAVKTNPGPFKQAYSVLGAYYQKQGNNAESLNWYGKLYDLDPTIPGLKEMLKR